MVLEFSDVFVCASFHLLLVSVITSIQKRIGVGKEIEGHTTYDEFNILDLIMIMRPEALLFFG